MTDLGAMYRASRQRVGELVAGVDPDLVVPASPAWTVHDVVAHLAGLAEDVADDNMAAAPSDEWTAAQIERGRDKSVEQLVTQWDGHAAGLEAVLSSPAGAASAAALVDVNTHEADLRHALGLPPAPDPTFLAWAAPLMRQIFAGMVDGAGLPPVSIEATDNEWLRSRLGRRTRDEAAALGWSIDPAPYLELWFMFGPRPGPLGEARC